MKAPPPKKGVPHFELEDALTRDGCAVCRLVEEAGRSYVEALLYESVNDPGTQRSFRSSLGFCGRHARPMLSMNEGLGVAILYGVAAKEALGLLSGIPDAPARPGATLRTKLAALLGRGSRRGPAMPEPGDGCAACRVEEKAEGRCLHALVEGAAEGYLDGSLGGPGFVCLGHLSRASALSGGWLPAALVEVAREEVRDLVADLGLYVRHNDHRFRDEPWGDEKGAPRRAVEKMVGTLGARA